MTASIVVYRWVDTQKLAKKVHASLDGKTLLCSKNHPSTEPRFDFQFEAYDEDWISCINCAKTLAKGGLWESEKIPGVKYREPAPVWDRCYVPLRAFYTDGLRIFDIKLNERLGRLSGRSDIPTR